MEETEKHMKKHKCFSRALCITTFINELFCAFISSCHNSKITKRKDAIIIKAGASLNTTSHNEKYCPPTTQLKTDQLSQNFFSNVKFRDTVMKTIIGVKILQKNKRKEVTLSPSLTN
jgi:hypothetical protein